MLGVWIEPVIAQEMMTLRTTWMLPAHWLLAGTLPRGGRAAK